nr:hypothetical protein LVJ77_05030 [Conchiformibius kuhniae]
MGLSEAGVVLGEAAAAVVLSAQTGGTAVLRGITARTDHAALTAPCPRALTRLADDCLHRAALTADGIGAVKTHGGGNYAAEERAFAAFRRRISFKPYIGHTLGAAGVAETVLLVGCLQRGHLPDGTPAPDSVLDYFPGFGGSHAAWVVQTAS